MPDPRKGGHSKMPITGGYGDDCCDESEGVKQRLLHCAKRRYGPLLLLGLKKIIQLAHGFLYNTRTDFMPFATLKLRPIYFNVF